MILAGKVPQKPEKLQTTLAPSQVINAQLDLVMPTQAEKKATKSKFSCSSWLPSMPLITCMLGIGILTASCGSLPKESAEAQSRSPGNAPGRGATTPVDVAIARTESLQVQPDYIGTTTPFSIVSVRSQVEGRLLALTLDVGDTVTKGQAVGQLDDAILLTSLRQAEAELAAQKSEVTRAKNVVSNARAELEQRRLEVVQAQADSKRLQTLFKQGAIAEQLAEQARTRVQTSTQILRAAAEQVRTEEQAVAAAQGRVVAQQAVVAQAKERRSYSRLISPITGVVTEKVTEPGNILQAGSEVLKIADFSRIKVVVQVSELELANIQIGQSVQVRLDAFPDQTLIGRVTRISPTADATARLVPIEVVIPNSEGKIGSGLLTRVNVDSESQPRVVVPQTAIQEETGNKITGETDKTSSPANRSNAAKTQAQDRTATVFLVNDLGGKTKVTTRAVTLGKKADGKVEILSGLQPGDRYVVRSGKPLKDGDTVRLSILSESVDASPKKN
ncbi:MAG: efflux RND transporter periplasmic adaptor subunit [Goleter apudmare HA4340-LM2]|jgi:multidrug efflux pump subunit AcrA (membrane-fusion protein)|nr:efflux RND transporter periplasmic adaptor subunit [Goleter apudmare HA4340-LM2]